MFPHMRHRALTIEEKISFEEDMKTAIKKVGGKIIYDTIDLYLARKIGI